MVDVFLRRSIYKNHAEREPHSLLVMASTQPDANISASQRCAIFVCDHGTRSVGCGSFQYDCLVVSLFALTLYEHVINIPDEILYIWRWKFKPFTLYLLSLRYSSLACASVYAIELIVKAEETCLSLIGLTLALALLSIVNVGVSIGYRVYALSRSSWPI